MSVLAQLPRRLAPAALRALQVALVLRDQQNFLVLRPREYLGYAPLYSGPMAKLPTRSARTIILWNGEIPSSPSSPSSSTTSLALP